MFCDLGYMNSVETLIKCYTFLCLIGISIDIILWSYHDIIKKEINNKSLLIFHICSLMDIDVDEWYGAIIFWFIVLFSGALLTVFYPIIIWYFVIKMIKYFRAIKIELDKLDSKQ